MEKSSKKENVHPNPSEYGFKILLFRVVRRTRGCCGWRVVSDLNTYHKNQNDRFHRKATGLHLLYERLNTETRGSGVPVRRTLRYLGLVSG